MIKKLTPEQEALMLVVRNEWINFCLGGDTSIDKEKAKQGITWIYSLRNLPPPKFIAFADGPFAAQLVAKVFPNVCKAIRIKGASVSDSVRDSILASINDSVRASVSDSVCDSVWNSVCDSVWNSVRASVNDSVRDSVRDSVSDSINDSVWNSVSDSVCDSVRDSVWASVSDSVLASVRDSVNDSVRASVLASVRDSVSDSVWNSVWDSVRDSVWNSVNDSVRDSVWNSVNDSVSDSVGNSVWNSEYPLFTAADAGWIAWGDFFMRIGLSHPLFEKYRDWIKAGHWEVLLFKDLAIIVTRPSIIKKDQQGRLHCDNGPAAKWNSGEEYWFWHGTRVNEQIILHPETITRDQITNEKNSEVSRSIAEKLGWDEYLKRVDTVLIHKWFDETTSCHYELFDFKNRKGSLQPRLLKMESPELNDGTRPYYIEPVPPQATTCQAARRWQIDPSRPSIKECNENAVFRFEIEA